MSQGYSRQPNLAVPDCPHGDDSGLKHTSCFRQALAVCLTNPKAVMFFMTFFPLFLTSDSRPATLGVMMAHVSLISLVYQTGLVLVGNAVAVKLSRFQHAGVLARRLVGLGLLGFGVKLAINRK